MANAEPNRADVPTCTVCGKPANPANKNAEGPWCDVCWANRSNWDEGARFSAFMLLGQAVALLKVHDATREVIVAAVDLALSEERDPRDDPWDGIHPDDANALAYRPWAVEAADPERD